jgi:hypothetical protein
MPGCCLIALVLFFGPRVLLAVAWVLWNWYSAFDSTLLAIAGFIFLPWTSLAWMYTYFHNHGTLSGGYVVLVLVAAIVDLGSYGSHRQYKRWRTRRA